jgi:serine/threonine-protein kinase
VQLADDARFCGRCGAPIEAPDASAPTVTPTSLPVSQLASSSRSGRAWLGQELPGGYVIKELLGRGSVGAVFRAEQPLLMRTVAVKLIHPSLVRHPDVKARFLREARSASRLSHPHSLEVFAFGETREGVPYIVTELLRGEELFEVLGREGPFPIRRAILITLQLLDAIGEAHRLGIVHRDLKPENVILEVRRGNDFVKVVDFGLARSLDASDRITAAGGMSGTPEYMSPEQCAGHALDPRSDLYSIGVMLFQMVTGTLPFSGETPFDVVEQQVRKPAPDLREAAVGARTEPVPDALAAVVAKALSKSKTERHADADELAGALRAVLEELEGLARARCKGCGELNLVSQRFCGGCGMRMGTIAPEAPRFDDLDDAPPTTVGFPLPWSMRDGDLLWLLGQRDAATTAGLAAACVIGEPGSGRTRLLAELRKRARDRGDRVIELGPDPFGARVSGHLARTWLSELGAAVPAQASPMEAGRKLAEACATATERGALLITIDDLDELDGFSWGALRALLRAAASSTTLRAPLFLACAARPGAKDPIAGAPTRRLEPPKAEEITALAARAGVSKMLRDGEVEWSPLYLEQALRLAHERPGSAPARLDDCIAVRLATLGVHARRVVQAVAVAGEAPRARLAELTPPDTEIDAAVGALLAGGWLALDDDRVRPGHPRLRAAVLAAMPDDLRRETHDSCARVGARELPAEVRARHAIGANDPFTALMLLSRLGTDAASIGDHEGAIASFGLALSTARKELGTGALFEPEAAVVSFSRKLANALLDAGRAADAERVAAEAEGFAGVDAKDRALLRLERARAAKALGRAEEAEEHLRESRRIAREG